MHQPVSPKGDDYRCRNHWMHAQSRTWCECAPIPCRWPSIVSIHLQWSACWQSARQSALAALVGVLDYMLHHGQKIFVGKFFAPDVSGQAVVHGREQLFGCKDGVMPNKWVRHSVRLSQDSRISSRMPIHVDEHSSRLLLTHRSSLYNIPNALTGKYIDRNATHICTKSNLVLFSCPVTPT